MLKCCSFGFANWGRCNGGVSCGVPFHLTLRNSTQACKIKKHTRRISMHDDAVRRDQTSSLFTRPTRHVSDLDTCNSPLPSRARFVCRLLRARISVFWRQRSCGTSFVLLPRFTVQRKSDQSGCTLAGSAPISCSESCQQALAAGPTLLYKPSVVHIS